MSSKLHALSNVRRFVILFPEYLGDFVFLIPFIYALKEVCPNATIDLYTTKGIVALAPYHLAIDSAYEIPRLEQDGRLNYREVMGFIKHLRSQSYDAAYFTNDYLFWPLALSGISTIIHEHISLGFRLFCKGTPHHHLRQNLRHASVRHIQNLEWITGKKWAFEDYNFLLHFPDHLIKSEFIPKQPYVYINVDGHSVKKYDRSFYLSICNDLLDRGLTLVLDGIKDGFDLKEEYAKHPNVHYTVGQTSLLHMFGLIKHCDWLVSGDSGPSHVACMFRKPSLIVHPPKSNFPFLTAGFYKENYSYKRPPYKSKCDLRCRFRECDKDYCKDDYDFSVIQRMVDQIVQEKERSWPEKQFEMVKMSVSILVIFPNTITEKEKTFLSDMQKEGYFIHWWDHMDVKRLTFKTMHDYIKVHRIHVVHYFSSELPFKLKCWNYYYRFSERAYITFLASTLLESSYQKQFDLYVDHLTH